MISKFSVISRKNRKIIKKYPSPGGEGAEIIYALRNNDKLSSLILNNLENAGAKIRKKYTRSLPSDPMKDYYFIIRDTSPSESIIVEYGFIDNINDVNKLKVSAYEYAKAVVDAILEYKGIKLTDGTYTVKKGDTLWGISKKFGIPVEKLKEINKLSSNLINIGDVLKLVEDKNTYIVSKGDTLWGISKKYNITVEDLKKANNKNNNMLTIGEQLIIPSKNKTYTVKKGDTLYSIAKNNNITLNKLKELNNIKDNNIISIGQELKIAE